MKYFNSMILMTFGLKLQINVEMRTSGGISEFGHPG